MNYSFILYLMFIMIAIQVLYIYKQRKIEHFGSNKNRRRTKNNKVAKSSNIVSVAEKNSEDLSRNIDHLSYLKNRLIDNVRLVIEQEKVDERQKHIQQVFEEL